MKQQYEFPNAFDVLFFKEYSGLESPIMEKYKADSDEDAVFFSYGSTLGKLKLRERNAWLYRAFEFARTSVASALLDKFFDEVIKGEEAEINVNDTFNILSHYARQGAVNVAVDVLLSLDQARADIPQWYLRVLNIANTEGVFEDLKEEKGEALRAQFSVLSDHPELEKAFSALNLSFSDDENTESCFAGLYQLITGYAFNLNDLKERRKFLTDLPEKLRYFSANQRYEILKYFNTSVRPKIKVSVFESGFDEEYKAIDIFAYATKKQCSLEAVYARNAKHDIDTFKTPFREAEHYVIHQLREYAEQGHINKVFPNIPNESELTEVELAAITLFDVSNSKEFVNKTKCLDTDSLLQGITTVARWLTLDLRDIYLRTLLNNTMLTAFLGELCSELENHLEWIKVSITAEKESLGDDVSFAIFPQTYAVKGARFLSHVEEAFDPYIYAFALDRIYLATRDVFHWVGNLKGNVKTHDLYLLAMLANDHFYINRYKERFKLESLVRKNANQIRKCIEDIADHLPLNGRLTYLGAFFPESGSSPLLAWLGETSKNAIRYYFDTTKAQLDSKRLSDVFYSEITGLEIPNEEALEAFQASWFGVEVLSEDSNSHSSVGGSTGEETEQGDVFLERDSELSFSEENLLESEDSNIVNVSLALGVTSEDNGAAEDALNKVESLADSEQIVETPQVVNEKNSSDSLVEALTLKLQEPPSEEQTNANDIETLQLTPLPTPTETQAVEVPIVKKPEKTTDDLPSTLPKLEKKNKKKEGYSDRVKLGVAVVALGFFGTLGYLYFRNKEGQSENGAGENPTQTFGSQ